MHTKDLTTGSPMKLILSFMLPLVFGLLFQQVYSMVDTIVVGKFLGVDALAGVGSTGSITFLVLGLCNGVCAGFAIPVAQKFGQRDFDGLRRFVGNMIWLGCVIAAAVTLVTTLLCRQILLWMDTPADTFSYAYDYIFVIFLGIPATMLYNLLSGILRSLGDSKTPLVFLIMCSLLNVVLDIVFILTLNMGRRGGGLGDAAESADLRRAVPVFHREEIPDSPFEAGRSAAAENLCPEAAEYGLAHGLAVFHHRRRQHSAANGGQRSGRDRHGGHCGGQPGEHAPCLPL